VSGVGFTIKLVERLRHEYGDVIAGIKDSGGDFKYTESLIKLLSADGFQVLAGEEVVVD